VNVSNESRLSLKKLSSGKVVGKKLNSDKTQWEGSGIIIEEKDA